MKKKRVTSTSTRTVQMADKYSCLRDVTPKNEVTGTKEGDIYHRKRKTQNRF